MAGFIPPHRQQQFLKACADFFHWWSAELLQLLPQKWRGFFANQQPTCRLVLAQNRLSLVLETSGRETPLGSTLLTDVPCLARVGNAVPDADVEGEALALSALLENIAALESATCKRIVLALADDYLLIREITLPLVNDGDIASVLAHEIDRLSPFTKNNVCYGYEILQKNVQAAKLRLRLLCLERAVLEGILAQCAELGLRISGVERVVDPASEATGEAVNLLPLDRRPPKEQLWNRANQVTAVLAAVLLFIVLALPIWHYEKQVEGLHLQVNALLEQSKVVRAKQARLVATLDRRDALVNRKNHEFEKIIILHNLTQVIPDNTWLTRVTVRDSSLEIEGESEKSSDLIEKLESEAAFYQVEFASSVTRNARTGKERFQIKMHLAAKPAVVPEVSSAEPHEASPMTVGAITDE